MIAFNRINSISMLVITALFFTGCTKQVKSPKLIYGSRQSGGIQIDRGVDGSAVPSINIGWTLHDIALVPVAVVVYDVDRSDDEYVYKETFQIWGTSKLKNGDEDIHNEEPGFANIPSEGNVLDIEGLKSKFSDENNVTLDDKLLRKSIAASADSVSILNNRAFFDNNIDEKSLAKKIADEYVDVIKEQDPNANYKDSLGDAIVNNFNKYQSSERHDAFSVFGSFTSNMNVEDYNAGISLGKIFATGVAAQLISSGSADALRNQTADTCLMRIRQLKKAGITLSPEQVISLCVSSNERPISQINPGREVEAVDNQ